jgi:TatD DNase family protein
LTPVSSLQTIYQLLAGNNFKKKSLTVLFLMWYHSKIAREMLWEIQILTWWTYIMQYFDTHAHIGLIVDDPIEQLIVIQEARQAQVARLVSICNSLHDFSTVYENLKSAANVYHAVGVSPSEVQNPGKGWLQIIEQSVQLPRVVAIGEIGLDYYRKFGNKNSQIELFITQLDLAAKFGMPVIIHNRDAGHDVLDILIDRLPPKGGILHCYSEDAEYAQRA